MSSIDQGHAVAYKYHLLLQQTGPKIGQQAEKEHTFPNPGKCLLISSNWIGLCRMTAEQLQ